MKNGNTGQCDLDTTVALTFLMCQLHLLLNLTLELKLKFEQ